MLREKGMRFLLAAVRVRREGRRSGNAVVAVDPADGAMRWVCGEVGEAAVGSTFVMLAPPLREDIRGKRKAGAFAETCLALM